MSDELTSEVMQTAQRMADEVRAEMRKYALSPKKERAAFESWVIWHIAVLSVTLNRLCENVEVLEEARDRAGKVDTDPGQENITQ